MRRILLLGGNGQVGWELQRSLLPLGEVIALGRQPLTASRGTGAAAEGVLCGDLARPAELEATVRTLKPDVIVNAAAYTAVDKAEAEPETARAINAEAPGVLAKVAAGCDAWLVHYSTDYVFDGTGSAPWREEDPPRPASVYGRTKLEGEELIRSSRCRHLIIRTSWVYASRGTNFPRTMMRLARERAELNVVDDQVGAPTSAELLADVTAHALRAVGHQAALGGTYHVAASGETSWFGYARYLLEGARARGVGMKTAPGGLRPVPSAAYPSAARRPLNSRLDCSRFTRAFGLHLPSWEVGVQRFVDELERV